MKKKLKDLNENEIKFVQEYHNCNKRKKICWNTLCHFNIGRKCIFETKEYKKLNEEIESFDKEDFIEKLNNGENF